MKHVIMALYILDLIASISALLLFYGIYLKYRLKSIKYYLVFILLFTLFLLISFVETYVYTLILNKGLAVYSQFYTCIIYLVWTAFFIYFMPIFIHDLLKIELKRSRKIVSSVFIAFMGILAVTPFFLSKDLTHIAQIFFFEMNFIWSPILIVVIGYHVFLIWKYRMNIENTIIRKAMMTIAIISIIFLPGIVLDFFTPASWVQWKILPYGFKFSVVYNLIWNVVTILYAVRFFVNNTQITPVGTFTHEDLLKFKITKREYEIIQLLAHGLTFQKIADQLFISYKTVDNHVSNIYLKLNIQGRQELQNFLNHL